MFLETIFVSCNFWTYTKVYFKNGRATWPMKTSNGRRVYDTCLLHKRIRPTNLPYNWRYLNDSILELDISIIINKRQRDATRFIQFRKHYIVQFELLGNKQREREREEKSNEILQSGYRKGIKTPDFERTIGYPCIPGVFVYLLESSESDEGNLSKGIRAN